MALDFDKLIDHIERNSERLSQQLDTAAERAARRVDKVSKRLDKRINNFGDITLRLFEYFRSKKWLQKEIKNLEREVDKLNTAYEVMQEKLLDQIMILKQTRAPEELQKQIDHWQRVAMKALKKDESK